MCVVSMIYDHYHDKWKEMLPVQPIAPLKPEQTPFKFIFPLTSQELEDLRKDIEEFKKLLERAREYDRKNNQPDCEMEEKRERVKKLAKELGVEIDFI